MVLVWWCGCLMACLYGGVLVWRCGCVVVLPRSGCNGWVENCSGGWSEWVNSSNDFVGC